MHGQDEIADAYTAQSLEHVLQNINKLNRSLEEVIAVGNEFSPVEALWSQFENVMAKQGGEEGGAQGQGQGQGQEQHGDEGRTEHEGETEVEREG
jgi:DASH complex subunit DAD1